MRAYITYVPPFTSIHPSCASIYLHSPPYLPPFTPIQPHDRCHKEAVGEEYVSTDETDSEEEEKAEKSAKVKEDSILALFCSYLSELLPDLVLFVA